MTTALLITFRETLEASLVVGILLAFLRKTENQKHNKYVWWGLVFGILGSVILMKVFEVYFNGFEGKAEEIYEGVMMILAASLITWMIFWMMKQRSRIKQAIENKAHMHLVNNHPMGLFFLSFVSVLREGIETVIFLKSAVLLADDKGLATFFGAIFGIFIAVVLAVVLFKGFAKVDLRKFFTFTSWLLILFAAGLLAHGIHEFQEAGFLGIWNGEVWNTNAVLNEKGAFGGVMKGLFGYNGNPSGLEVLAYLGYMIAISFCWRGFSKA